MMGIEVMSAADAAWLHMDRPTNHMIVNPVVWTDQPVDVEALKGVLSERLVNRFRRFRQRVQDPTMTVGALSGPQWFDAALDLDAHVHLSALPEPADVAALQAEASRLASEPLDPAIPLWALHVLTGYGDGRRGTAVLLRTHHAIADGAALMQVLLSVTDREGDDEHANLRRIQDDETTGHVLGVRGGGVANRLAHSAIAASGAVRTSWHRPGSLGDVATRARRDAEMLRKLGFGMSAPPNRLQGALVPQKRLSWTEPVPVADLKAAGRASGRTINDLVLSAISATFTDYFQAHQERVDEVIVIVPVDLRPKDASLPSGLGNRFGLVFASLPTGEEEPETRQVRVKAEMDRIKASREGVFIFKVLQVMGQLPRFMHNAWIDTFAGKASAIVTNMVGPRHAVEIAGTPVRGAMAWVPVTGPLGLGLSIFSYNGGLAVGVAADTARMPDLDVFVAHLQRHLAALTPPRGA